MGCKEEFVWIPLNHLKSIQFKVSTWSLDTYRGRVFEVPGRALKKK